MLAAKRRPSSRVRHSHAPPSLVSRLVTGRCDRFKSFAKELVDLRPDALLGVSRRATDALAKQTQTLPIVFAIVADPIRSGFAVSLSRPGRNITGFTEVESTLGSKNGATAAGECAIIYKCAQYGSAPRKTPGRRSPTM
jgi:ABC transporter substrate binding protein